MKPAALTAALADAKNAANAFDNATQPINKDSDRLDNELMKGDKSVFRSFSAARLRYSAGRYDREARLNQSIAGIYELQVRQNNVSAEHHHRRSKNFFFGMLAAAGAAGVSFSLYVYLRV